MMWTMTVSGPVSPAVPCLLRLASTHLFTNARVPPSHICECITLLDHVVTG